MTDEQNASHIKHVSRPHSPNLRPATHRSAGFPSQISDSHESVLSLFTISGIHYRRGRRFVLVSQDLRRILMSTGGAAEVLDT